MITIVRFCSSKSNFDLLLQLHKSVCSCLSHETGPSYLNKSNCVLCNLLYRLCNCSTKLTSMLEIYFAD